MKHSARHAWRWPMRLAVMLSFLAGLRVGEIAALSVVDVVDGEVRFTPNTKHSLAGTPSLPGITWLRGVVYYHGVVGRLAHTMVKVSQNGVDGFVGRPA